jgi:hypothetical protein
MASDLLKTLKKIEEARCLQIETARELGYNIKDNASFLELATIMQEPARKFPIQDYNVPDEYPTAPDWERPAEWPDCYTILRSAKPYNNFYPICILLFKNAADTIDIPVKTTNTTNVAYWHECGLEAVQLSDGIYYNLNSYSSSTTKQTTHTWDKSKDIVDSEGNTYRWIIGYLKKTYAGTTNADNRPMLNFAMFPATEILLGDITFGTNKYYTAALLNWSSGSTGGTLSKNLVHFEVLPECNMINATYANGACKPCGNAVYLFQGCTKLECLDFGPGFIFHFSLGSNYGIYAFEGATKLNKLDLSKVKIVITGSYSTNRAGVYPQTYMEFKPPMTPNNWTLHFTGMYNTSGYTSQWYLPNYYSKMVEQLKNAGYSIGFSTFYKDTSRLHGKRPNVELENDTSAVIYQHEIRKTVSNATFKPIEEYTSYNLLHLDLSNATLTGSVTSSSSNLFVYASVGNYSTKTLPIPAGMNGSYITNFEYFPNLTSVIWPNNSNCRVNLLGTSVTKETVLDLFEKCVDLTGKTVYNPYIFIPKQVYVLLNEEELAIATNKGWKVYDAIYKAVL